MHWTVQRDCAWQHSELVSSSLLLLLICTSIQLIWAPQLTKVVRALYALLRAMSFQRHRCARAAYSVSPQQLSKRPAGQVLQFLGVYSDTESRRRLSPKCSSWAAVPTSKSCCFPESRDWRGCPPDLLCPTRDIAQPTVLVVVTCLQQL